jgi:transglutaminase-like putative cysteine protease
MRYAVRHSTTYRYDRPVTDSLGSAHLVPRTTAHQTVTGYDVEVRPAASDLAHDDDYYGNRVTFFQVTAPHTELVVAGRGEVEVTAPALPGDLLVTPCGSLRPLLDPALDGAWRAADFALPSELAEHAPAAVAYAADSLAPDRPVGEAVTELMHRVHSDFAYDPTATTVTSTVAVALERRAGVCQDFAHLLLAGLRGHGLAARYVSGYLATGRGSLVGAAASHAWVSVWLGGDAWLDLDPTNAQVADDRYVTVAWGRDYGDVAPVKGVIVTDAEGSAMDVAVEVLPLT